MKLKKFFFLFYKLLQPPSKLMLMLSETTSNSWPPICIFIVHLMLVNCIFIVHNTLVYCRRNSNKNTRKTISSRKSLRKYLLCKIYFLTTFTALIKDKKTLVNVDDSSANSKSYFLALLWHILEHCLANSD